MSKNALALVDCNNRDVLFQYIIETFDRKASKNEMVSPYDDQLIGKMNFRYNGMEHSMFFTYARSSEYPGKRFRNRKIIYLSLGVNETSSDIFNQICSTFGGFIDHNDDLDDSWQKIERIKVEDDPWQKAMEEANKAEPIPLDVRMEMRQLLKMDQADEDDEDSHDREPRDKENRERRHRPERRRNGGQAEKPEKADKPEKAERAEKAEPKAEPKANKKNEPGERKEDRREEKREERRDDKQVERKDGKEERKDDRKDEQNRRPRNHHRGHRPRGRKNGDKPEQKPEQKSANNEAGK